MEIKLITAENKADINLPNQPFRLFGRMIPSLENGKWDYRTEKLPTEGEMCFPDENYDFDEMSRNSTFLGAYDGDKCIGLAVMQDYFFRYWYLNDLKVSAEYRGRGVATALLRYAAKLAPGKGYRGIYTVGQDNNLAGCLFYLKFGFEIGGFDNRVYRGTVQEDKSDILFYYDCPALGEEKK